MCQFQNFHHAWVKDCKKRKEKREKIQKIK